MSRLSITLRSARKTAGADVSTMSRLVGVSQARLEEIEAGSFPTPVELDSCALAFGVTSEALARGEASRSPMTRLLFRAGEDGKRSAVDALAETDAHRVFGDFLRAVSQLSELDEIQGRPRASDLPRPPPQPLDPTPPYRADVLATWLRDELGLGIQPITSMRAILDRLQVPVFFVTPEELDPAIDGASTSYPRPAVLVNLVEGARCWWRTRMTLAHELCHLLVDHRDAGQPAATISPYAVAVGRSGPRSRKRFEFYNEFDLVERRAGAFAACFLAPAQAVLGCVGQHDPTSEHAISLVGRTFGMGRTAACYRLKHVYRLSDATHRGMIAQGATPWIEASRWSDNGPDEAGLRSGVLRDSALTAFAAGKIDRARCHEYLNLPYTEWLPSHPALSEEQRRPLLRVEDSIRGIAQQHLQREVSSDLVATAVVAGDADGWHVDVVRRPGEDLAGSLVVTYDRTPQRYVPIQAVPPRL